MQWKDPVSTRGVRKMNHTIHDIGVGRQIAAYSDAIEVGPNLRWLLTSGTPGLATDGDLPKDISGQAELAWKHVISMLERAGMTVADIVKVTQYLTRSSINFRRHKKLANPLTIGGRCLSRATAVFRFVAGPGCETRADERFCGRVPKCRPCRSTRW